MVFRHGRPEGGGRILRVNKAPRRSGRYLTPGTQGPRHMAWSVVGAWRVSQQGKGA